MMTNYSAFSVIGIEIEYMLVDRDTLSVRPESDSILKTLAGEIVNEVELGDIAISNELVMHVLELKNNGPRPIHEPIAQQFQNTLLQLQPLLKDLNLQLLPTAAHPWMNPQLETKRWPHGDKSIYQQYDAIFDCQGHGWANLQSMHLNFPFANDVEFSALHSAIRCLLPLLPALAASSPILNSQPTGMLDSRLDFYEKNQQPIPQITGDLIPEWIESQTAYEKTILNPMYQAISGYDPNGILQHEWLNSRGVIPKFSRMALEIRIIDTQECVNADIAIAHLVHALLKDWYTHDVNISKSIDTKQLKSIYDQSIRQGMKTQVTDEKLLDFWRLPKRSLSIQDIWELLIEQVSPELNQTCQTALEHILRHGNLSERILRACQQRFDRKQLMNIYRQLSECLLNNELFLG